MIQLDDEQYWLYAAVDPDLCDSTPRKLESTRNDIVADQFLAELHENHGVDDAIFSSMTRLDFREPDADTAFISDSNDMEVGTASNIFFVK